MMAQSAAINAWRLSFDIRYSFLVARCLQGTETEVCAKFLAGQLGCDRVTWTLSICKRWDIEKAQDWTLGMWTVRTSAYIVEKNIQLADLVVVQSFRGVTGFPCETIKIKPK